MSSCVSFFSFQSQRDVPRSLGLIYDHWGWTNYLTEQKQFLICKLQASKRVLSLYKNDIRIVVRYSCFRCEAQSSAAVDSVHPKGENRLKRIKILVFTYFVIARGLAQGFSSLLLRNVHYIHVFNDSVVFLFKNIWCYR